MKRKQKDKQEQEKNNKTFDNHKFIVFKNLQEF